MVADPEVDVGDVTEAVAAVEPLRAAVLAEYRQLDGVGAPGAGFGYGPLDQGGAMAAAGHIGSAVELADEDRALRARLGALGESVATDDQAIGSKPAFRLGDLDQRRRVGELGAVSGGGAVLSEEGGQILGLVEVTEGGDETVGTELGERLGIGWHGGAEHGHSVGFMHSEKALAPVRSSSMMRKRSRCSVRRGAWCWQWMRGCSWFRWRRPSSPGWSGFRSSPGAVTSIRVAEPKA